MKKYKLIKCWPNSPKLGTVISYREGTNMYFINGLQINPQDYPEFWEEVVEKTYEILELRGKISGCVKTVEELWKSMQFVYKSKEYFIACFVRDVWEIYSVKRLSDNKVFTFGDRVDEDVATNNKYAWNISEFSLKDNRCFTCGVNINNIQKVPEILFTTEDGIDIIDPEQEVYWVSTDSWRVYPKKAQNAANVLKECSIVKYYSTWKAAENYIKCNKPVLSYNDVSEMIINIANYEWYRAKYKSSLTKLVKSKL